MHKHLNCILIFMYPCYDVNYPLPKNKQKIDFQIYIAFTSSLIWTRVKWEFYWKN